MAPEPARIPSLFRLHANARTATFLIFLVAFAFSITRPDIFGKRILNTDGGEFFGRFFAAARRPILVREIDSSIDLLPLIREGVTNTIAVAFASLGLAIIFGAIIGLFASEAFWDTDAVVERSAFARRAGAFLKGTIVNGLRFILALMRSVHELVWALLLTSVWRVHLLFGILALAIPFAASYARIFAETLDETPRGSARALRALGGADLPVFCWGLLPRAMRSMLSYTFYRFDCAVRSSAILGFVGFPTLGLFIKQSFGDLYFREVWTWLYTLLLILMAAEVASGLVRRRIAR